VTFLLDANVLIALTVSEHEHHDRATVWASTVDRFAICPIVEGSLIRFLIRLGEPAAAASEVVKGIHHHASCEFWPDSISYREVELGHVLGHRQVTDAYLVRLARAHAAALATLDEKLARSSQADTLLLPGRFG
jgi:toxin-antitoxin system PIN domain toxin